MGNIFLEAHCNSAELQVLEGVHIVDSSRQNRPLTLHSISASRWSSVRLFDPPPAVQTCLPCSGLLMHPSDMFGALTEELVWR